MSIQNLEWFQVERTTKTGVFACTKMDEHNEASQRTSEGVLEKEGTPDGEEEMTL